MTAMAAELRRRSLTLGNPLNRPGLLFDAFAVLIALLLAIPVARAPIMSGDYGQWLMVSRYYSGKDVPAYREIEGVAPLVPLLLALIRIPVPDPFDALNILRVGLAIALPLSFYVAGASLFRSRAAGLLSIALVVVGTGRFMELFAFGGMLQIASLAFMLLSLAALGRIAWSESRDRPWWSVAAGAATLAILSHAGSVVIVVPVISGAALLVLVGNRRRRSVRNWGLVLAPAVLIGLLGLAFWLVVLAPANSEYGTNPASLSYRGPERVLDTITSSRLTFGLVIFGAVALLQGTIAEARRRTVGGHAIVAWWALVTWTVFFVTAGAGVATDYPRFVPPLLAPLMVGAAAGLAGLLVWVWSTLGESRRLPGALTVLLAAALLIAALGRIELRSFEQRASGYAFAERESIGAIAKWIDESLPEGQTVLVFDSRDGKWIEGLTGESTVFANKVRYSFREDEWERSVAADALIRSTTAFANGLVAGKFINSGMGPSGAVPRDLLVAMNHDGEYIDFLQLPDARARVISGLEPDATLATLGALRPQSVERTESEDGVRVKTTWSGMRQGVPVTWTRTVSVGRDSQVIDLVDEVTSEAPISGLELELRSFTGLQMTALVYADDAAVLLLPRMGSRHPRLDVEIVEGGGLLSPAENGTDLLVSTQGSNRLHVRFTAKTTGAPISALELLYPPQLLEDYGIGAAVLKAGPAFEQRLKRLEAIGLRPQMEIGGYVLLVRERKASWPIPLWASDGRAPKAPDAEGSP